MKQCSFCESKDNIKIASMTNTSTKETASICHVCFNQAAYCDEGLLFEGRKIEIALPRPNYQVINK